MSGADRRGGGWGPTPPVPDTVPDELVERYGEEARRSVAAARTSRHRRWWRGFVGEVSGEELWVTAAVVFAVLLMGLVFLGGLVVAAVLWPLWTAAVVIPVLGLGLVSLLAARRLVRGAVGPEGQAITERDRR